MSAFNPSRRGLFIIGLLVCAGGGVARGQAILVRTPYLNDPLGRGRQVTLYGMLDGTGALVYDPNLCGLNDFGDPTICTTMATHQRRVDLIHLRQQDPLGTGRNLYSVTNSGLPGRLYLVVPPDPLCGPFRFVHITSAGRRVVGAERLVWTAKVKPAGGGEGPVPFSELPGATHYERIEFQNASVVPGFVNDTYFLTVSGETPHINMKVRLIPYIYVTQPEFWGIEVVATSDEEPTGPPGRYYVHLPLDGIVGTKGVEVIGKSNTKQLPVPPTRDGDTNATEAK